MLIVDKYVVAELVWNSIEKNPQLPLQRSAVLSDSILLISIKMGRNNRIVFQTVHTLIDLNHNTVLIEYSVYSHESHWYPWFISAYFWDLCRESKRYTMEHRTKGGSFDEFQFRFIPTIHVLLNLILLLQTKILCSTALHHGIAFVLYNMHWKRRTSSSKTHKNRAYTMQFC